jgi:hypothetical protein
VTAVLELLPRGTAPDLSRSGEGSGGGPTLDEEIVGVWEGLAADLVAHCPLCSGNVRSYTGSGRAYGRCADCGTMVG